MKTNRRSFLRSSSTLAAGAALGALGTIGVQNTYRQHGPVTLWTPFFFCQDDLAIPCEIFSDERKDKFGVRTLDVDGKRLGVLEASLLDLKEAFRHGERKTVCLCFGPDSTTRAPLAIVAEGKTVTFLLDDGKGGSHPFRMNRSDIVRVL